MLQHTKKQNRPEDINRKPEDIDREIVQTSSFPPEHVRMVIERTHFRKESGLENLKREALGVHGIGSITLFELLQTGKLPTGRSPNNEGHIYLYPFSSADLGLPGLVFVDGKDNARASDEAAIDCAASYAYGNSELFYKARLLELDLTTPSGWEIASQLRACGNELDEISDDIFTGAGVLRDKAEEIAALFPEIKRGFLVFVGKSARDEHECGIGDKEEGDVALKAPNGLSLKHCMAIVPLTDEDEELIEMLQRTA